ncbi:MAG: ABC transporter ATP-binding protein [Lachnospiraceae bacterium]|nr:ABC transporter ATP-binding protein [Lachnospiraceae bacterium]
MKSLNKITIKNLSWQNEKKKILDNIDTVLEEGKIYGILGPNGAGKTSLVRSILGFVKGYEGSILYDQTNLKNIKREELAKLISFLPQNVFSDVDFTAYDVVAMGREPHRKRFKPLDDVDKAIINEAMEFTDCVVFKDKSISKLSGGELQRVMIARTVAQDTPWVVLDEPVASLDIKHQMDLVLLLNRLKKEKKKTIILILHDINLASKLCDCILLLKDGKLAASGEAKRLLNKENLNKIFGVDFLKIETKEEGEYILPRITL